MPLGRLVVRIRTLKYGKGVYTNAATMLHDEPEYLPEDYTLGICLKSYPSCLRQLHRAGFASNPLNTSAFATLEHAYFNATKELRWTCA